MTPTRRQWLQTAMLGPVSLAALRAARKDFWQSKDPAAWTSDEKQIILFQSPWAREGALLMELQKSSGPAPGYGNDGRPATGMPEVRPGVPPGGTRSVPIGEKLPPVPDANARQPVKFRVLVRWETAKPVRLAGAPELPDLAGQFYVIRLRGLPLMPPFKTPQTQPGDPVPPNPNEALLQQLKEGSRLERNNKPAIACARLFAGSGDQSNEVLLLFPRDPRPISEEDHVVTLESRFAQFHLSLKFPLADMLYKGQLTL